MKALKYFTLAIVLFLQYHNGFAQEKPRYYDNIQKFKKQDSITPPPKDPILLVGSSSFTRWKDVQAYFPNHTMLNRGFGGAHLTDLIRYAEDVIYPYNPKQVVIYCGENDFLSKGATPDTIFNRFKTVYDGIRQHLGKKVNVTYISIKPSPRRRRFLEGTAEVNAMIENFLKKEKNAQFIDVYSKMLRSDGQPIGAIFTKDSLHMNADGYAIWQKEMAPVLLK
ncbi:G-D-S-L family lipolytic protein [Parapusillimonas sp. SGNA-6]|uniref:GDSL-type esterase/lipase family protein n=1 Tax=Parapedobacter sp. SGR-10 TaxID=2710879 RepID=UPI0013D79F82|nr:GDSL-type esterase/lipase family protein [Parapedobacter sp. SGR-10]NGF57727.1 G-D-S-L family lipolytic protein [Parapedobacter sp. SGR-10]NGM89836.1 G-D-S-L family lipolytic protein [Parapusillimonas sp. SGNA-6]